MEWSKPGRDGSVRRVEPAFPDLLPVTHRLGGPPCPAGGVALDPVEMRLRWGPIPPGRRASPPSVPKRPVRALVHATCLRRQEGWAATLVEAGCGLLVVLDEPLAAEEVPAPRFPGQVVAVAPRLLAAWGTQPLPPFSPLFDKGVEVGVLLPLAPLPEGIAEVHRGVAAALEGGARFVAALPLVVPPPDRHRLWDALGGVNGDEGLENLLFHSELASVYEALEREASRVCTAARLAEVIPGPATACLPLTAARAASELLLWARRLDTLDGIASAGWQLRRAARALLAAGKDPFVLAAEDNLRIVPGFDPWVEAFARSLWQGAGEPFDGVRERWLEA